VFNGLVLVAVLGFPVAVVLAWAFEVTDGAIRRTSPERGPSPGTPDPWARVKAAAVGAGFVAVVWVGVGLWRSPDRATEAAGTVPTEEPVLAVLPFEDFSPGGDQAYLADGLHEELLHQLAMLRGISLISRTSVSHFRGSPATVAAIGDSLGANYVLEGSIRRAVDSVQVTVQLIDAASDAHLWSESYGAALTLDDLFDLQRRLATRVAGSLGGTLAVGTGRALGVAPTASLEAYNAYLRGLHHWSRFNSPGLEDAVADLERAVELDPEFGRAHARLAMIYGVINNFGGGTQGELFPLMREHAELAVRYAPDDPVTHLAQLARHWPVEWDWEAARRDLETALALDPDLVDARWALAEWYGVIEGNTDRGLEVVQEAVRLDPFSIQPLAVRAWILTVGQRYAEAAEEYRQLLEREPGDVGLTFHLATNLGLAGRADEALARLRQALPAVPTPRPVTLAVHFARAGDTIAAREVLDQAVALKASGGSVPASGIAAAYAALGDVDEALTWLERSFDEEGGIYYLRSPDWAPLWGTPRFRAIWDRVALPGAYPEVRSPGS
jgi:adenylate cyclase